ncbi:MAG: ATP-binding protein [Tissierellia bacterium]|nr:ATP-binding protein [Tissierellia bacterium]
MKFVGRETELKMLNQEFEQGVFALSIIYGRRRVGKTFLIQEFIKDKEGYYFVALESNEIINLSSISQSIYLACGLQQTLPSFTNYEDAFRFLFDYSTDHRVVFVIDEYPYLASASTYISSLLQKLIDEYRSRSQLFLILCGSSMSFMENQVLGYKSPLYGRRTSQHRIQPFGYLEASKFVESYSDKEKAIVYGLTSGVAEYLTFFSDTKDLRSNIIEVFLSKSGRLFEEPSNLLKQELREPKMYNDILFAIANSCSKLNEIANRLNKQTGALSYYLKSLMELDIIERKTPVLDRKTKRPIYSIKDSMFRFWFGFVQPNLNFINLDMGEMVYDQYVQDQLNLFMGKTFEQITFEYYETRLKKGELPFLPKDYGNWWGNDRLRKKESEIDLLSYNDKGQYLLVEAKWKNQITKKETLTELIEKSRMFAPSESFFWITSLSGFEELDVQRNIELITLEDMYDF